MDNDINKKIKIKIEVKFLKCELKVKINSLKSFDDEFVKYSFNTFVKNATRMYHVAKFQNLKERFSNQHLVRQDHWTQNETCKMGHGGVNVGKVFLF